MDSDVADTSAELAGELLANEEQERAAKYVDPASIPTRFTLLKLLALSPAHYRAGCQRDQDDSLRARLSSMSSARDRKDCYRFGTAVHGLIDDKEVAVYTARRDPRAAAWKEFQAEAAARGCVEILNPGEMRKAKLVVDAIKRNEDACRLLFDGTIREQRIDWRFCGKEARSTPDARGPHHSADLKTAQTAHPEMFRRQGMRLFYHCQGALYADAIEEETGTRPGDVYIIVVEKSDPYPVSVLRITDRALEVGAKVNRLWIEQLLACERANQWPEYIQGVGNFDLDEPEDLGLEFNGRKLKA